MRKVYLGDAHPYSEREGKELLTERKERRAIQDTKSNSRLPTLGQGEKPKTRKSKSEGVGRVMAMDKNAATGHGGERNENGGGM